MGHHQSGSNYFSDSYDEVQVNSVDDDTSLERKSPKAHMVKGHSQRYHYKDGSVRWKEKEPYSSGGNKDE